MKKVYLVVLGSPKDMEKIQRYQTAATSITKKYGAMHPAESYQVIKTVVGDLKPQFISRLQYPNVDSIEKLLKDPDYLEIIADRDAGFADLNVFIITE